jgi:hypothetical protein
MIFTAQVTVAAAIANPTATSEDRQIDKLVYALYGLTDEEIGIVEE